MIKPLNYVLIIVVAFSCQENNNSIKTSTSPPNSENIESWETIRGQTMGTTYNIKFNTKGKAFNNLKRTIDSTLVSINAAVSTYEPESIISNFNKTTVQEVTLSGKSLLDRHFINNYMSSKLVYSDTDGAFDATVMPLVNYWGFGYTSKKPVTKIDSNHVSQLQQLVGMNKIMDHNDAEDKSINNFTLRKLQSTISLDFSGIAKGYGVDIIAQLLDDHDIETYMVEIGGEVKVATGNNSSKIWKVGINEPLKESSLYSMNSIVNPKNMAMATSGNYRNYYETNDLEYGHEINPVTGFPIQTDIFSASVIHESCQFADAYATAFMIMGLQKSLALVNARPDLEACFIIKKNDELVNVYSYGFEQYVIE